MMWDIDQMKPLSATVVLSFFIHTCVLMLHFDMGKVCRTKVLTKT